MQPKLDERDSKILALLQRNCRITAREIARKIDSPITTVFAKIKRMEKQGVIQDYKAVLDAKKLHMGTAAFILASFSYRLEGDEMLSQRQIVRQIAGFPEVQEVHIITGDWDILMKVRERDVDAIGNLVIDRLRTVKGIEKTLTCMVFETEKETTDIKLELP
jgi:DNA-binding Lrp family transcriptional regulator